jgi:hypothetical protein
MAKNIVTLTNCTLKLLAIYRAPRHRTTLFPSLIFSISDTHKHVQSLPYGFFFCDTEINRHFCLLVGLPCRQISGFQLSNKPTRAKVRGSHKVSLVIAWLWPRQNIRQNPTVLGSRTKPIFKHTVTYLQDLTGISVASVIHVCRIETGM